MTPHKTKSINGHKVEQFYWAGRMVVYVDNHLQKDQTFEEVCADLEEGLAYIEDCDHYNTYGWSATHG